MPKLTDILFIALMSLVMMVIVTLAGCTLGPRVTFVPQEYCERDDYGTICKGTNQQETNLDWLIREHNRGVGND